MKTVSKLVLLGLVSLSVPVALSANNTANIADQQYDLPQYQVNDIAELPKPEHTVAPIVQRGLAGTTIEMKFTVDTQGNAFKIRPAKPLFSTGLVDPRVRDFASQMSQILLSWKFSPALNANGQPVEVDVIMPVNVVKKGTASSLEVTLKLDERVIKTS